MQDQRNRRVYRADHIYVRLIALVSRRLKSSDDPTRKEMSVAR